MIHARVVVLYCVSQEYYTIPPRDILALFLKLDLSIFITGFAVLLLKVP